MGNPADIVPCVRKQLQMAQWKAIQKRLNDGDLDADMIQGLEEFVYGNDDLTACIALLKLYSLFPDKTNCKIVGNIVIKAIMKLPRGDVLAVKYLLNQQAVQNEFVDAALKAADLLEAGRFVEFWNLCRAEVLNNAVQGVNGFGNAVRQFILSVVQRTCHDIAIEELGLLLDLKNKADVVELLTKNKLNVEGNNVNFPVNVDHRSADKTAAEDIPYERLQKLL
jgi:translation initiation factor 3 subunit K